MEIVLLVGVLLFLLFKLVTSKMTSMARFWGFVCLAFLFAVVWLTFNYGSVIDYLQKAILNAIGF